MRGWTVLILAGFACFFAMISAIAQKVCGA